MLKKTVIVVVLLSTIASARSKRDRELEALANAERAFAKMSVEQGVRAAFLANFTDDGLSFTPEPVKTQELYGKPPADSDAKPKITLDWYPVFTDLARSGELGYNTGPYTVKDNATGKLVRFGEFFSIWKKQPDGTWKVVLDMGVQHAQPPAGRKSSWRGQSASPFHTNKVDVQREAEQLKDVDQQLSGSDPIASYGKLLDDEARLLRQGLFPVVGKKAVLEQLKKSAASKIDYRPISSAVADSADLGYTYGSYTMEPGAHAGYYTHVWKRNKAGDWKLVLDVTNPEQQK